MDDSFPFYCYTYLYSTLIYTEQAFPIRLTEIRSVKVSWGKPIIISIRSLIAFDTLPSRDMATPTPLERTSHQGNILFILQQEMSLEQRISLLSVMAALCFKLYFSLSIKDHGRQFVGTISKADIGQCQFIQLSPDVGGILRE